MHTARHGCIVVDMMEISDRPVSADEIVPCPADCDQPYRHRHLKDGDVQPAHQGFGITATGEIKAGPPIPAINRDAR